MAKSRSNFGKNFSKKVFFYFTLFSLHFNQIFHARRSVVDSCISTGEGGRVGVTVPCNVLRVPQGSDSGANPTLLVPQSLSLSLTKPKT